MTCELNRGSDNDLLLCELSHEVSELRACLNRISLDARFLQADLGLGEKHETGSVNDAASTKIGIAIANILCECSRAEADVASTEVASETRGRPITIVTSEDPFGD